MSRHNYRHASTSRHSDQGHLLRGQACTNCRKRKIRCDGDRPICGQCTRATRLGDPCEYIDPTRTRTQILEDTIADLNGRIEELERSETGQSSAPGIVLHQPYDDPIGSISSHPGSPGHLQPSAPSISSRTSSSSIQQGAGSLESQFEEPPHQERQALLDSFLSHASQFGFFLDRQRFRQSAMLPLPLGDQSRSSPSLLATAYLIGHTLSQQGGFSQLESSLLTDALRATASMEFDTHPHHVIHRTQAEILLSNYFFRNARFLEARHHASNAHSLAAACSLHRLEIISGNVPVEAPQTRLPPPSDESEIVERIAAFWAVYTIHNLWSASLSTPISLSFDVTSQINIPWPSEVDRERRVGGELDFASNDIVRRYLAGDQNQGVADSGLPALFAKTSVLFERATNLSPRFASADQSGDAEAMSRELDTLTILVESIRSQLPSLTPILDSNSPSMRLAVVTHTLVDATVIKLNAPFSKQDQAALQRCISASQRIINSADNPLLLQLGVVNPIMAVVWPMACQVIMHEIVGLQVNRAVWTQGYPSDEELQRRSEVEVCIHIMGAFTAQSSFMDTQLSKVQLAYTNINT